MTIHTAAPTFNSIHEKTLEPWRVFTHEKESRYHFQRDRYSRYTDLRCSLLQL